MPASKIEDDVLRREARARVLSWGVVVILLVITVALFALGVSGDLRSYPNLGWLFVSTLLGTVIGACVLAFREARRLAERQMNFVLGDSEIIRKRQGYPDVKIAFSEVETLREEMRWLVIKTHDPGKRMAIPNNVRGYSAIRAELAKHHPLSARATFPWKNTGLLSASILSWSAVILFRDVRIVIAAGSVGLVALAFASRRMWTLLHRRSPRWLLWGSIASAWLMAILLIYFSVERP